ncbi:hypothetical protein HDU83_005668 [Entophlyctis luteolus]|nr:hypothetical protein HDU83_005668 [Entophlyctis luteolus]KAJ3380157.1 hypothetical protein HDU84_006150 [Entophlyctis sp. JEL0112]
MEVAVDSTPLLTRRGQIERPLQGRMRVLLLVAAITAALTAAFWLGLVETPQKLSKTPQPVTGEFAFDDAWTHLRVSVFGKSVGDALIIASPGTSNSSHVVFSVSSDKDSAQRDTRVSANLSADGSMLDVVVAFPDAKSPDPKRLHADVRITLPQSILAFDMRGYAPASLVWEATDVALSFDVHTAVGSVEILSPLNTSRIAVVTDVGSIRAQQLVRSHVLSLQSSTGSISLQEADIIGPVFLQSGAGRITGTVRGYTQLDAHVSSGSINLSVYSAVEEAPVALITKTGSVSAQVFGFRGSYHAATKVGAVRVSGNVHRIDRNSGWVGSVDGKGSLIAETVTGSVDLKFL